MNFFFERNSKNEEEKIIYRSIELKFGERLLVQILGKNYYTALTFAMCDTDIRESGNSLTISVYISFLTTLRDLRLQNVAIVNEWNKALGYRYVCYTTIT